MLIFTMIPMLRIILLLAHLSLLAGCTANVPLGESLPTLDTYRVGQIEKNGSIDDWDKTFIPVIGDRSFSIVDGSDSGSTVTMTIKKDADKEWMLSLSDRASFAWNLDDSGITCPTNIDLPSGSTSTFTPALPVIPKNIQPGTPMKATGKISVVKSKEPSKSLASGDWKMTITHDADVTLKIGKESVECTRIYTNYYADLGLATVKRHAWDYYAKDRGLVASVFKQTVTKLIIPEHTSGTWILTGN